MDPEKTYFIGDVPKKTVPKSSYLTFIAGGQEGRLVKIGEEPLLVGRAPGTGLQLEDVAASGRHCVVRFEGEFVVVEDLGSTNGTLVDEEPIEGLRALPPGSVLQIGQTLLRHDRLDEDEAKRRRERTHELRRAVDYVQALLPRPLATGPVRTHWRFIPSAELGGDAFGYYWMTDDRLAVYLLDVCGHGAAAALHSVSVLNLLRSQSLPDVDFTRPDLVLAALNDTFQMDDHGGMYFTFWYGVYEASTRKLVYASAGHPPGLLVSPGRSEVVKLQTKNMPIGITEGIPYRKDELEVAEGSALYLYSDGTYEVKTGEGEDLGPDAFVEIVGGPTSEGTIEPLRIEREIRRRMESDVFDDDFSVLQLGFV